MVPPSFGRLSTLEQAWLLLEVAALAALMLGILAWTDSSQYAQTNGASHWFRALSCLPWVLALGSLLAVQRLARSRPELTPRLRAGIRRALPLLALWLTPVLLGPTSFGEQPVFLLLLTAASALGLDYSELMPAGSRAFGGVLLTLVSNPVYTLSRLLTPEKTLLGLQLLVPLGFLPVRYRRAWLLLLPGLLVVGLADSGSPIPSVHLHYATHFLPYLFVAAIGALAVRARTRRPAALCAVLLASLVSTLHFGAFLRGQYKTSFHDLSFDWTATDAERGRAFARLSARIPDSASVCAGEHEGPHVARRSQLFSLKQGCRDAEYVVYGPDSLQWGGGNDVDQALTTGSYGVVDSEGSLVLLAKGHETSGNAAALERLRAR